MVQLSLLAQLQMRFSLKGSNFRLLGQLQIETNGESVDY